MPPEQDLLADRRHLFQLIIAASAIATGNCAMSQEAENSGTKATDESLFVIGPFSLAEWLSKQALWKPDALTQGLISQARLGQALGECHAFIIDARTTDSNKKIRFGSIQRGFPKIALSGTLNWVLKEGELINTVNISSCTVGPGSQDYRAAVPLRKVKPFVELGIHGSDRLLHSRYKVSFSSDSHIIYDIHGQLR